MPFCFLPLLAGLWLGVNCGFPLRLVLDQARFSLRALVKSWNFLIFHVIPYATQVQAVPRAKRCLWLVASANDFPRYLLSSRSSRQSIYRWWLLSCPEVRIARVQIIPRQTWADLSMIRLNPEKRVCSELRLQLANILGWNQQSHCSLRGLREASEGSVGRRDRTPFVSVTFILK